MEERLAIEHRADRVHRHVLVFEPIFYPIEHECSIEYFYFGACSVQSVISLEFFRLHSLLVFIIVFGVPRLLRVNVKVSLVKGQNFLRHADLNVTTLTCDWLYEAQIVAWVDILVLVDKFMATWKLFYCRAVLLIQVKNVCCVCMSTNRYLKQI